MNGFAVFIQEILMFHNQIKFQIYRGMKSYQTTDEFFEDPFGQTKNFSPLMTSKINAIIPLFHQYISAGLELK